MSIVNQILNLAYWSSYGEEKVESYWHPVAYEYDGKRFKRKSLAAPGEPNFEKFGNQIILYSKEDDFAGMVLEKNVDPIVIVSSRGEMLRVGDRMYNNHPITSLRINGNQLYVNGHKFEDLQKEFMKLSKKS